MNRYDAMIYLPVILCFVIYIVAQIYNQDWYALFLFFVFGIVFILAWKWVKYWTDKSFKLNRRKNGDEQYY